MKVAVTGKGGVGKTTVTAALARTVARLGTPVVAVDADPNPNLGIALGLGLDANERLEGVANDVLTRRAAAHGHSHAAEPSPAPEPAAEELLDRLGSLAPDGVRLLQTGRIERPSDGCLCCGSHRSTRRMFEELSAVDRLVIADLEAGVTDLCWTDPKPTDTVLVVATPDRSSVEIARRAIRVARDLEVGRIIVAANRIQHAGEAAGLRELLDGVEVVEIPEDPAIAAAERREASPLDLTPASPAMLALHALALRLL